jgi:PEP-CTERM motif-containing protein
MNRFLPVLLLTMTVVPAARADSITYVATEQLTKATPTQEDFSWMFTGPRTFDVSYTLTPAPASILDPSEKPGEWLQILSLGGSGDLPSLGPGALAFATYGTFGHLEKRCWPNCVLNEINKYSTTFTDFPGIGFEVTDRSFLGTFPIGSGDPPPVSATPEPSSLLLFGSGILGLGFARKFIALAK